MCVYMARGKLPHAKSKHLLIIPLHILINVKRKMIHMALNLIHFFMFLGHILQCKTRRYLNYCICSISNFTYQPDLTCATTFDICLLFASSLWQVAWESSELDCELWNLKLWPLLLICMLVVDMPMLEDDFSSPGTSSPTDRHSRCCLFIHSGNEQTKLSFCTALERNNRW